MILCDESGLYGTLKLIESELESKGKSSTKLSSESVSGQLMTNERAVSSSVDDTLLTGTLFNFTAGFVDLVSLPPKHIKIMDSLDFK